MLYSLKYASDHEAEYRYLQKKRWESENTSIGSSRKWKAFDHATYIFSLHPFEIGPGTIPAIFQIQVKHILVAKNENGKNR